mmetsp:Transcript_30243/g.61609  ORF Transcript_30243/g.61609 Transcript_30243/m.61609 type:complete len:1066 (-) Transcript_30243:206-3403(-)
MAFPSDERVLASLTSMVLLCILWNLFNVPFRVAFAHNELGGPALAFDIVSDVVLLSDVLLHAFFLPFVDEENNEPVTTRMSIFTHYMHSSRASVQLFAAIPFELIVLAIAESRCSTVGTAQLFAILRFIKLGRALEVPQLVVQVESSLFKLGYRLPRNVISVVKVLFVIFLVSHFSGCTFFFVAISQHRHGSCHTWVDEADIVATCDTLRTEVVEEERGRCEPVEFDLVNAYTQSLYWAVATLTTVGYGDISASRDSPLEVLFCTVIMLIGTFGVYTRVIAHVEEIMSNIDVARTLFNQKADYVRRVCERWNLPDDIGRKIDTHLETAWLQQHSLNAAATLRLLPPSLHAELVHALIGIPLRELFFIKDCPHGFVDLFAVSLEHEQLQEGDWLFYEGAPAQELFILVTGKVQLFDVESKTLLTTLTKSCTIGEHEFFSRGAYVCSAQAMCSSEVCTIDFNAFWRMVCRWGLTTKLREKLKKMTACSTDTLIQGALKRQSNITSDIPFPLDHSATICFLVEPSSAFYKGWKMLALLLVLCQSIAMPLIIAFAQASNSANTKKHPSAKILMYALDIFIPCFFALDIVAHLLFFKCKHQGRLVSERKVFRRLYIRGYLAVDVLSALPLSPFASQGTLNILRIFQLTRIIRLGDYFKVFVNAVAEHMHLRVASTGIRRIISWAPLIVLFNHVVACSFYVVSRESTSGDNWIARATDDCTSREVTCDSADYYLHAFYWTLYTLTTTGFGQVHLATNQERLFAMFVMVLGGVICDAGVTAILASLFSESDHESATTKRRNESTMRYLESNSYQQGTKLHISAYTKHVSEELEDLVDTTAFMCLSPAIRRDITNYFCLSSLKCSGIAATISPVSRPAVLFSLASGMYPYVAVPGERLLDSTSSTLSASNLVFFVLVHGHVIQEIKSASTFLEPGSLITNCEAVSEEEQARNSNYEPASVTVLSFASMFKLCDKTFAITKQSFKCVTLPFHKRLPPLQNQGAAPTYGQSIINMCREVVGGEELKNCAREPSSNSNDAVQAFQPFMEDSFFQSPDPRKRNRAAAFFQRKVYPDA